MSLLAVDELHSNNRQSSIFLGEHEHAKTRFDSFQSSISEVCRTKQRPFRQTLRTCRIGCCLVVDLSYARDACWSLVS